MKLSIGFSPCPNDTFIFDALVNKKIDTHGIEFEPVLEDVQTLNTWAIQGKLDVTKLSYAVLPLVWQHYFLLDSGGALGKGVGPLLITKNSPESIQVGKELVAIPGENTTAHLLFSLKYPRAKNKVFVRYDEVENFVAEGIGLGVIIHENRFTYASKGLQKIADLGDYWEQQTKVPIPLGGIVVSNKLPLEIQEAVERLIKESIEYSYGVYPALDDYIRIHSQEMSEEVMRKHIELYVNDYSLTLGEEGRKAVKKLVDVYSSMHGNIVVPAKIFV